MNSLFELSRIVISLQPLKWIGQLKLFGIGFAS